MPNFYMTRKGFDKLHSDLAELTKLKQELSVEIGEAMAQGDLRENAAYTFAKERQTEVLRRMGEIQDKISKAQIIEEHSIDKTTASIGANVVIKDIAGGAEFEYQLAGSGEADPASGSISVESPLGSAVLGKKQDEEFVANLPAGPKKFKLVKLSY